MKPELEELERRDCPTPIMRLPDDTGVQIVSDGTATHALVVDGPGNTLHDAIIQAPTAAVLIRVGEQQPSEPLDLSAMRPGSEPAIPMALAFGMGEIDIYWSVAGVQHMQTSKDSGMTWGDDVVAGVVMLQQSTAAPPAPVPQVTPQSVVQLVATPNLATPVIATAMQGRPDVFSQGTSLAFADPSVVEWLSARK